MTTETAQIGQGIYTAADVARILNIPYTKANYWFKYYLKNKLEAQGYRYYFTIDDNTTAVNFLTLIEIGIFYDMKAKEIKTNTILLAHKTISERLNTPYPFAYEDFYTYGKLLLVKNSNELYTADKFHPILFSSYIEQYMKKIEFGDSKLAHKFYPLGKEKSIVVNPENQFGQPIIDGTNILAETLYDLHLGGDKKEFIADLYDIPIQSVIDAIEFSKAA